MSREYPVIRFQQREVDNGKTPGSGSSKKPKWVLSGEDLVSKYEAIINELEQVDADWEMNEAIGIPKTLKISFIDKAKAKSHQSKIVDLFSTNDKLIQIGMASEYEMIVKMNSRKDMAVIKERLSDVQRNDIQISAIKKINEYVPLIDLQSNQKHYKIHFFDYRDTKVNVTIEEYVSQELEKHQIHFENVKYGYSPIIEIFETNIDKLRFVRQLPVKGIEPMEETLPPFPFLKFDDSNENLFIKHDPKKSYPTIGLLDSGVEKNEFTKDWVTRGAGSYYTDDQLNTSHGTYISSLLIHGDRLNNYTDFSFLGCYIVDVPIVPSEPISGATLIRNIETAILSNPSVNIWNLSISLNGEIQNNRFSDFAIELDRIQTENNVLILKSAGNDSSFYSGGIAGKLSIGADSVKSLTVGSVSRKTDEFDFSIANYPSPYSRVGRGPAYIIKPEVVHYGGDIFALKKNPLTKNEFEVIGEKGFSSEGVEEYQVGTSFSTPKIAKTAAELEMILESSFDPLLIKALLVHSANYNESPIIKSEEKIEKLGYGKTEKAKEILTDESHSVTLLLQGTLDKGRNIDIMDFPYPKELIRDGKFYGRIKATLIYDPYLDGGMGDEYCQSNMELKFGTFSEKFDREGRFQLFNPIGRKDSKNLLNTELFAKNKMKQNKNYGIERLQIKYGDKYYPVKKYDCDLGELREGHISYLNSERTWYLFLEGQYRDSITKEFLDRKINPSMKYCLLITIMDPEQEKHVFNSTMQSLEQENFIYNEINTEIRIDVEHS